jgi:hypothetical protein
MMFSLDLMGSYWMLLTFNAVLWFCLVYSGFDGMLMGL